jgi:hypothetical protein
MATANLTPARIRELLDFDAASGAFTWRTTRGRARAGEVAGALRPDGYRSICIDGAHYLAHRLVVFMVTGVWPVNADHKNGDRGNNSVSNLRAVSVRVNRQNQRAAKRNSMSGLIGAYFDARAGRWYSNIRANGRRIPLGRFDSAAEAHQAYVSAKRLLHEGCTI